MFALIRSACLVAALVLAPCALLAAEKAPPRDLKAAIAEYRIKLEEYQAARQDYEETAAKYWNSVAEKRRSRNAKRAKHEEILLADYVVTQPPVYSGPPEPVNPEKVPPEVPSPRKPIPVVADFLQAAAEQFKFAPELPRNEIAFKRAYAKVASDAGLTKDQAVRIYGFESGGNGRYDVQAGLEYPRPNARAISTALGYNQLLTTNTVELLAEEGDKFLKILKAKAASSSGPAKKKLETKIEVLARMVAVSQSVPDRWSDHTRLGMTPKGLAMHAMNLDIDVGPLLQTQKLLTSVIFARNKGYAQPLTAAELEMMNLTGDGTGLDMVTMPLVLREKVPTANFFQPAGYAANPVASRNNTVAKLIMATDVKMDKEIKLQGAKDLAAAF